MNSFAIFRLPYTQECILVEQTSGQPQEIASCRELTAKEGFVLAPFAPSAACPILLIRPDKVDRHVEVSKIQCEVELPWCEKSQSSDYHRDFSMFHTHLLNGDFKKLVLSRSLVINKVDHLSPVELFQRACERYPRMMISLVYTPQSGMWLTSTPEILLSGNGHEWQTIALAGTMKYGEDLRWGDKNIQEQRYVATYITRQLEQFTDNFTEEGPRTARAGHLAHLRSDFRFSLSTDAPIGDLLQALHPTPAVCGLPKQEAFQFILQNEHHDRSYYSGFMGPLFIDGQTNLFVTLRCMQLFRDGYQLHAGGGLLKDSVEELEWQETETKLDTMRNIIYNNV